MLELGALLKTRFPRVRRGLVIRDSWPLPQRQLALALADPDFLAVERTALDKLLGRSGTRTQADL